MTSPSRLNGPSWWDLCSARGSKHLWAEFKRSDGSILQLRVVRLGDWHPGKLFYVACTDKQGVCYNLAGRCPLLDDPAEGMRTPTEYTIKSA